VSDQALLINRFYTAFQHRDYAAMQALYHPEARFSDPVFRDLTAAEVKAMWQMLLTASKDLRVTFCEVTEDGHRGACRWDAWYTFSRSGRPVHNRVKASFRFKDGLIYRHTDSFDFWRWSRQALGAPGLLMGWSSFLKNSVRRTARKNLDAFIARQRNEPVSRS